MLDKAALHFCLADAFHPGCELTWPMRHPSLYEKPFRIRRRRGDEEEEDHGATMDQATVLSATGPLNAQRPGGLTRWMAVPWQGDTAYCRSGYEHDYDPFLPTYWPARVPHTILTRQDYEIVMNQCLPRVQRLEAFNRRANWFRLIDQAPLPVANRMKKMVEAFGAQGIIEARPGIQDDPDFPPTIYVENVGEEFVESFAEAAALFAKLGEDAAGDPRQARLHEAGWGSEEHLRQARALRARERP
jgi:hypothetical protein